jgi:excisionase family DNA binding protein
MEQNRIAMTLEEASKYTGIGRNTLRNLIAWDKLPVLRVGRKILIRTDMLDRFVELNEGRNLRKETDVRACRPKKG